ncbi:DnaA ATPase domain-containing protein [Bifidobacterium bifidum]|uniref:DnaA ATPase domain-containing protein n=1 Tax=Bifidobacterium bifidum TaxID=1681 RepID=UPI003CFD1EFC
MLESPHSVRRIRLPNEGQPTGDDHARHQSDCTSEQGSDIQNARADPPSAKCLYLTSEDHANEFVMTAQDADLRQDRITLSGNRFRHIDMVLIDDFQYFAGRTALQEQLLQTL